MTEDNIVSSKLGIMYGLDENINPLRATNLLPSSQDREDNQNIPYTNSHAVSMIQKLSEFKELTSKVSKKRKSVDQLEKNFTCVEKTVSYETSSNIMSSNTFSYFEGIADVTAVFNDKHTYPVKSTPSADILTQDDVGKKPHVSTSAEKRKAEVSSFLFLDFTFVI